MAEKRVNVQVGISEESVEEFKSWLNEMQEALDHLRKVARRAPVIDVKGSAAAEI